MCPAHHTLATHLKHSAQDHEQQKILGRPRRLPQSSVLALSLALGSAQTSHPSSFLKESRGSLSHEQSPVPLVSLGGPFAMNPRRPRTQTYACMHNTSMCLVCMHTAPGTRKRVRGPRLDSLTRALDPPNTLNAVFGSLASSGAVLCALATGLGLLLLGCGFASWVTSVFGCVIPRVRWRAC